MPCVYKATPCEQRLPPTMTLADCAGIYRRGGKNRTHSGGSQSTHRVRKSGPISGSGRLDAGIEKHPTPQARQTVILADTTIWIDHVRSGNKEQQNALKQAQIVIHPGIAAELAVGPLWDRSKTLAMLDLLPQVRVACNRIAGHDRDSPFVPPRHRLTDARLIASVLLDPHTLL